MKRTISILMVVISIVTAVGWWWIDRRGIVSDPAHEAVVELPTAKEREASKIPAIRSDTPVEARVGQSPGPEPADVRAQFRASNDYWEFAERFHGAAKRGDGAAQYYLAVALEYCQNLYGFFFYGPGISADTRIRTLDEAQQLTATKIGSLFSPDDVRDIQNRCQRIMEKRSSPFGTYVDWMAAAIKSGYPLAQVRAAAMAGLQGGDKREARALALDALRSRDAEVVWELSSTAAFLKSDEPGEGHEQLWTWRMAACLRAADCNSMTDWKRLMCEVDSQCHRDDTVVDVIRRGVGNNFIEIERRARELNEKIDAGSVDSSDL